MHAVTCRLTA